MKKLVFALSLITLSSSLTVQAFSQDIIVPKNHKGEAMTLAALAKDAAWRQKVAKQWKMSQLKMSAAKRNTQKLSHFYATDNTQEASLYDINVAKYTYN